jgi:hypothetical protein
VWDIVIMDDDNNDKSASWFGRLIKVKGFKKSVIIGGITGIVFGVLEAASVFAFEVMRIRMMSLFPFGGLLADGFGVWFWWGLIATLVGCVLMGVVGGGVAVAVAVRGWKDLNSPKKVGMVGGAAGGILVFFVVMLGVSKWRFGLFAMTLSMLPGVPFVLADVIRALLGN